MTRSHSLTPHYSYLHMMCMRSLELDIIGDRIIGNDATGGLAGEQRKRVTMAVELASNPR